MFGACNKFINKIKYANCDGNASNGNLLRKPQTICLQIYDNQINLLICCGRTGRPGRTRQDGTLKENAVNRTETE